MGEPSINTNLSENSATHDVDETWQRFNISDFSTSKCLYKCDRVTIWTRHHEKLGSIAAKYIENYMLRKRELEIIARIKPHKNLVKIYGLLYENNNNIARGYVMEHMYASLEKVINSQTGNTSHSASRFPDYSYKKSIEMAIEICDGILFLHQANVVHRDVKPSNQGTLIYMAPELGVPTERVKYTESCDVYSCAITMFELFLKRRAYADRTESGPTIFIPSIDGIRPRFPENASIGNCVKALIEKCWSADPALRPKISQVQSILLQILNNEETGKLLSLCKPKKAAKVLLEAREEKKAESTKELSAEAGGKRTLMSVHGTWLRAVEPEWKVDMVQGEPREWEHWYIEDWGRKVVLKARGGPNKPGQFLRAHPGGAVDLVAHPKDWEIWLPFKNGNGSWSFRDAHGSWLSAREGGSVCTVKDCDSSEQFRLDWW